MSTLLKRRLFFCSYSPCAHGIYSFHVVGGLAAALQLVVLRFKRFDLCEGEEIGGFHKHFANVLFSGVAVLVLRFNSLSGVLPDREFYLAFLSFLYAVSKFLPSVKGVDGFGHFHTVYKYHVKYSLFYKLYGCSIDDFVVCHGVYPFCLAAVGFVLFYGFIIL